MKKINIVFAIISCCFMLTGFKANSQAPSDVFISEYVEGTSNNKAIEIYNGTGSFIDLGAANYVVQMYFNGSTTAGNTITLTGTVASNNVFILAQSLASFITANGGSITPNQVNSGSWYNGDDAIILRKGGAAGTIVDVVGQLGFDPGTEWGTGLTSTADNTIRRKTGVCTGDIIASDAFDPTTEWDGFAADVFTGLGSHTNSCSVTGGAIVLTPISLSFTTTVGVPSAAQNYALQGTSLTADVNINAPAYFEVAASAGGPFSSSIIVTAATANAGTTIYIQYNPAVAGIHSGNVTQTSGTVVSNIAVSGTASSGTLTPVYTIQGSGVASALDGTIVTTEGIVTADFQGTNQLGGFYLQDVNGDGNSSTSDGIFVFTTTFDVHVGDIVRVTGEVDEFFTMTEIKNISDVAVQSTGNAVMLPVVITLPVATADGLEQYEGMLVKFTQTLTVTETFTLARFGEVSLSTDGRVFNPTHFVDPNDDPASGNSSSGISNVAAVTAQQDLNNRRRILLDDGSNVQNPPIVPYIDAVNNTLRCGSTLTELTGVLDFAFSAYRIQPTIAPAFNYAARPAVPSLGNYNIKTASFNVLNYFNGDGNGGGFPTARGANTLTEFNRQRVKIINAITAMDADILGLTEIENDGDGTASAIADLVNGLNAATSPGTYAYIADPTGGNGNTGTDAIKVAIVYKPAIATPVGLAKADISAVHNRPPLAQTFSVNSNGQKLNFVIVHFKSKSCTGAAGADADQLDGQGCYNDRRKLQADALVTFINTLKTSSGTDDVITVGDYNAYDEEDPMDILRIGGLTDILPGTYSYVFDGQSGSLDHGFTSQSLYAKVSGADKWHINADEPVAKDYNQEFNPPYLYNSDAFRSSDHDPVLAGLLLTNCITDTSTTTVAACSNQLPYNWNGTAYNAAGTYFFDTTNTAGCDSVATLILNINASPVASATAGSIVCNAGTTTVTINATSGTAPYTGTGNFTVAAGTYIYIINDFNGCADTAHITVTEPAAIAYTAQSAPISCFGGTTTTTILATGGTAPYTFRINSKKAQTSNIFNNLKAGSYLMTITDASACSTASSFTITQPTKLKLVITQKNRPSCIGATNGSIVVNAVGGTAGYQYSFNNGAYSANNSYTNLAAGNYTILARDANGCTVAITVKLADTRVSCGTFALAQNQSAVTNAKNGKAGLSIKVLPNPTTTNFTLVLQSNINENVQVIVTDLYGKKLYSVKGSLNQQYSFGNNFVNGMYIVQVIQGRNIQTLKLVKGK
ncbi:hypothetical protein BH10BAC2_BH10BAC2_11100 [soil metagenome]